MKQIPLSMGLFALVSDQEDKELSQHKWSVSFGSHSGQKPYARRYCYKSKKRILMHRQIMGFPEGLVVDHLNDNSLDNRRSNLEAVTVGENTRRHYARNGKKRRKQSSKR
jgi:hypothetical protein